MTGRYAVFLLAGSMLAGCTVNSGVSTTPTFSQARQLPATPAAPTARSMPVRSSYTGPVVSGRAAVQAASRGAIVEPTSATMVGAVWMIRDPRPNDVYRVWTTKGKATTIILPAGERFNAAVGGDVAAFLINTAFVGVRPAVSILPRTARARSNLQLVTTGGAYGFELVPGGGVGADFVDIERTMRRGQQPDGKLALGVATTEWPQPSGDYTALSILPVDGKPRPAWSPAEAWADSTKLVVRFDGPLPVQPVLFVGQRGEQTIGYRTLTVGSTQFLVTDRRVTEGELRVDSEVVRFTTDPDGVRAGWAADPAQGADGWRPSQALSDATHSAPSNNVAVFVMPGGTASSTMPAGTFGTSGTLVPLDTMAAQPKPPVARQPMANGMVM
jgi:hypothetical protein